MTAKSLAQVTSISDNTKIKIFIIAGEASGDIIGAKLMQELKLLLDCKFYGIGGDRMTQEGISPIFPMSDISLMGYAEIIPHLFKLISRINFTAKEIERINPNIIITIDSLGFNYRVVKKIKHLGIKLVHYVAPTVWAYKANRAKKIAKLYDHLLTILPFEPAYFIKEGLASTFVGHHLAFDQQGNRAKFRKKYKIADKDFILCVCPGSRKGEISRLMPDFIDAINKFIVKVPDSIIVIPTFHHLKPFIEKQAKLIKTSKVIICNDSYGRKDLIASSNLALTKCGTITNEFAVAKVPMIAAYKINFLTAFLIRRMLKIKSYSLVNILAKKVIIPEYIQEDCTGDNLFAGLFELFSDKKLQQKQVSSSSKQLLKLRNKENIEPGAMAAKIVVGLLDR